MPSLSPDTPASPFSSSYLLMCACWMLACASSSAWSMSARSSFLLASISRSSSSSLLTGRRVQGGWRREGNVLVRDGDGRGEAAEREGVERVCKGHQNSLTPLFGGSEFLLTQRGGEQGSRRDVPARGMLPSQCGGINPLTLGICCGQAVVHAALFATCDRESRRLSQTD